MPINSFNVGHDVSIQLNLPTGPVVLSYITDFNVKQMVKSEASHGIDGINRFQEIPSGWDGTITIDRADPNLEIAIAGLESLYYAGANVPPGIITQTINEVSGAVSQRRYTGVVFNLASMGNWRGDSKITQSMGWKASQMVLVQ